jgi:hypothetical protein
LRSRRGAHRGARETIQRGGRRKRKENGWNVWGAIKMERAWSILAVKELEPSIQVAELAFKAGAASKAKDQGLQEESYHGARSRKPKFPVPYGKVNSTEHFQVQLLLFVHTQNTSAKLCKVLGRC